MVVGFVPVPGRVPMTEGRGMEQSPSGMRGPAPTESAPGVALDSLPSDIIVLIPQAQPATKGQNIFTIQDIFNKSTSVSRAISL